MNGFFHILIRLSLAILLMVATAYPSNACGARSAEACCCCEEQSYDVCSISNGSCCSYSDNQEKAAQTNSPANAVSTADYSSDAMLGWTQYSISQSQLLSGKDDLHRTPLHLASNKIYLLKRSLLI